MFSHLIDVEEFYVLLLTGISVLFPYGSVVFIRDDVIVTVDNFCITGRPTIPVIVRYLRPSYFT